MLLRSTLYILSYICEWGYVHLTPSEKIPTERWKGGRGPAIRVLLVRARYGACMGFCVRMFARICVCFPSCSTQVLGRWLIFTSSPRGDQSGVSHILHPPSSLRCDDDASRCLSIPATRSTVVTHELSQSGMVSPDDSMLVDNNHRDSYSSIEWFRVLDRWEDWRWRFLFVLSGLLSASDFHVSPEKGLVSIHSQVTMLHIK